VELLHPERGQLLLYNQPWFEGFDFRKTQKANVVNACRFSADIHGRPFLAESTRKATEVWQSWTPKLEGCIIR
jgi:hypothetical protein